MGKDYCKGFGDFMIVVIVVIIIAGFFTLSYINNQETRFDGFNETIDDLEQNITKYRKDLSVCEIKLKAETNSKVKDLDMDFVCEEFCEW